MFCYLPIMKSGRKLEWQEKAKKVFRDCRKPWRGCTAHKNRVTKIDTHLWESCLAETYLPIYYSNAQPLTLGEHWFLHLLHKDVVHPSACRKLTIHSHSCLCFSSQIMGSCTQCQCLVLFKVCCVAQTENWDLISTGKKKKQAKK